MELCVLAKIVLLLAVISIVFHICIFGITIGMLADALFMTLLIFIANRYCDHWIAKGIVIYAIISTLIYFFMCYAKRQKHTQTTIYDELYYRYAMTE